MRLADEPHDKQAIARAFGRAAGRYDRFSTLQRESGEKLMALIADHPGIDVLDAGCGTGYFSARWQQRGKAVTALDLSEEMLRYAQQQQVATHYLSGDIECLPLPDASVDICFSNLAVQWCDDLSQALAELYRVTRPGGVIAFSTLTTGTLAELYSAWQQLDGSGSRHINRFLAHETVVAACQRYRHQVLSDPAICYFPDVISVMKSLKGVGATWLHQGRNAGLLGRSRFNALAAIYPRQDEGYPLTYQRLFGVIYRD
ncbi:malonyl-ACP O-methyltransferase BioC [Pectobacteriaceae bacterium CE70]|nr:malonyl-ACP O-methyltransferase BioC [Pectobacteriaceae bacterium CE70]WJY12503.1 malonyl-ACP O-methyltransferase BioC [Pectobacteriaceae bacterium C80]